MVDASDNFEENDATAARDEKLLQSHVARLAEHFDTVQIFCSRHQPDAGGTIAVHRGAGNWFANYGNIKQWVIKQEEQMRVDQRPD